MKTTITIILMIAAALYAAGLHIETNPFRIRFESWLTLLGWVVIAVGVSLITAGEYEKGLKRGRDITTEILEELATKNQQDNERKQTLPQMRDGNGAMRIVR